MRSRDVAQTATKELLRTLTVREQIDVSPGAHLLVLVLSCTLEDTIGIDLSSSAMVRLRVPWPDRANPDLAAFDVFTPAMLVALGEKGVKTLDDLGDLASDELIEILGAEAMDEDTANAVIMAARAHWFDDEAAETPGEPAEETGHD